MVGLKLGQTVDRDQVLAQAGRHPVRAERRRVSAGQVPRPRRLRRGLADLRGVGLPAGVLGRRGRAALADPSAQRRNDRAPRAAFRLSVEALRPARGAHPRGRWGDPARAGGAAGATEAGRQAAGGPSPQRADPLRPGNDAGGRLLSGHRELQPAAERPSAGIAAGHAVELLSRRLSCSSSTSRTSRAADPRHVRRRPQPQGHAGRARIPPAQRAGQPAAAFRGMGRPRRARRSSSPPRRGLTSWKRPAGRWSSR